LFDAIVDHVLKAGKRDVVFITYNFAMGASRDAAIAKLKAANIGLVAMKTTTPSGGPTAPPGAGRGGRGIEGAPPPVRKPGAHLAGLKWAMKNPAIATCVVTMMDTDVLEENFKAMTEPLTPAEERLLVAVNEDIRPSYCRMCFECAGQCPQGMPVPNVLRYLAYADFNGDFLMGRQNFLELPESVQQVRCGECESCSVKCANGVKVQARLMRAQEMFA
jgi:predicted aldo/keto reductase-like oxidoreductase